jgi:predicted Zn-dependent peptidase
LTHQLKNGLTILGERMPGVRSAAMSLIVPAGGANDPVGKSGLATVLAELVLRGAGDRDSQTLTNYLDSLGLQRSSTASIINSRFACAALAETVLEGLPVYADLVRRAHLPEEGFGPSRDLAIQSVEGIDDEPRQKLMLKLRECFWPWPMGRNAMGVKEELQSLTLDDARQAYQLRYSPDGAILAIAGNVDLDAFARLAEQQFGDWSAPAPTDVDAPAVQRKFYFEKQDNEQTHIGIAYPIVDETHPDYYTARLTIEVLSGGMSGRLFTEIREKRALVYSVSASYSSMPGCAGVFGYAGTSNERAQQTLDQFIVELHRLSEGITQAELDRAKIGLKASTIMSGESTSSRSGAIAHDWIIRKRLRTIDEITAAIDAVTLEQTNAWLAQNPAKDFTIAIGGPKELQIP